MFRNHSALWHCASIITWSINLINEITSFQNTKIVFIFRNLSNSLFLLYSKFYSASLQNLRKKLSLASIPKILGSTSPQSLLTVPPGRIPASNWMSPTSSSDGGKVAVSLALPPTVPRGALLQPNHQYAVERGNAVSSTSTFKIIHWLITFLEAGLHHETLKSIPHTLHIELSCPLIPILIYYGQELGSRTPIQVLFSE